MIVTCGLGGSWSSRASRRRATCCSSIETGEVMLYVHEAAARVHWIDFVERTCN